MGKVMLTKRVHVTPRDNHWGHSIEWFDFDAKRVHGWLKPLPVKGDVFDCEMNSGRTARFKFVEVQPCGNPSDMFFATVEFVKIVDAWHALLLSLKDNANG